MAYSPHDDEALRDIVQRVEEAKLRCAILVDQSAELFVGTSKLIEQSKARLNAHDARRSFNGEKRRE